MPGGLARAFGLVRVDLRVVGPLGGVDDDHGQSGRQFHVGPVDDVRLDDDDDAVDGLLQEAAEGDAHILLGGALDGDDRDRVAGGRG